MPVLHLEIKSGHSPEQNRDFAQKVIRVTAETLKCQPESIDVIITEIPNTHWTKGGQIPTD